MLLLPFRLAFSFQYSTPSIIRRILPMFSRCSDLLETRYAVLRDDLFPTFFLEAQTCSATPAKEVTSTFDLTRPTTLKNFWLIRPRQNTSKTNVLNDLRLNNHLLRSLVGLKLRFTLPPHRFETQIFPSFLSPSIHYHFERLYVLRLSQTSLFRAAIG